MLSDLHRRQIDSSEMSLGVLLNQVFVHFVPRRRKCRDTISANQSTGTSLPVQF